MNKVSLEMVIDKEMWEKVKGGVDLTINEEEIPNLPIDEINRHIEDYESGRRVFLMGARIMAEALLRKLPPDFGDKNGIIVRLIAKSL